MELLRLVQHIMVYKKCQQLSNTSALKILKYVITSHLPRQQTLHLLHQQNILGEQQLITLCL